MKILKVLFLAALACVAVGCGKKPKLPEGTACACYIDLQKSLRSAKDVSDAVIEKLPSDLDGQKLHSVARKACDDAFEHFKKGLQEYKLEPTDLKWMTYSVGSLANCKHGDDPDLCFALHVKKIESLPFKRHDRDIAGEKVYLCKGFSPFKYAAIYDEKYVLAANTESALELLIKTYKGDRPASSSFDDLSDLSGETVARLQVAGISDLMKDGNFRFSSPLGQDLTVAEVLNMTVKDIDEEMYTYLSELEGAKVDFALAKDEVGVKFTLMCGSRAAAKCFEDLLRGWAVEGRLFADAGAILLRENARDVAKGMVRSAKGWSYDLPSSLTNKELRKDKWINFLAKSVAMMGRNLEVDRSGSETSIGLSIPLETFLNDFSESLPAFEKILKEAESDDDSSFGRKKSWNTSRSNSSWRSEARPASKWGTKTVEKAPAYEPTRVQRRAIDIKPAYK